MTAEKEIFSLVPTSFSAFESVFSVLLIRDQKYFSRGTNQLRKQLRRYFFSFLEDAGQFRAKPDMVKEKHTRS